MGKLNASWNIASSGNEMFRPAGIRRYLVSFLPFWAIACSTGGSYSSDASTLAESERGVAAVALKNRIYALYPERPIFSVKQSLPSELTKELAKFIGQMGSAVLVYSTVDPPIFWIKVDTDTVTVAGSTIDIRYDIVVTHAPSNKVVASSKHVGRCNDSGALVTIPAKCSVMRPLIFSKALEKL